MSDNSEQNGRQPPLPQHTAPPSDPRNKNVSLSNQHSAICRDFVWGICTKGALCKFRHDLELESMKSILKFCHDYQNQGCTRPDCTYLHTSNEEETLFLTSGQMPRVLAERHAAISTVSMAPEGVPQGMYDYMGQPPPPPPTNGSAPPPLPPAPLPSPLMAPPPPPPPPTGTSTLVRPPAPVYTAPPPHTPAIFPVTVTQPPPPIPIYDASRPPPPLSTNMLNNNGALKRPAEPCEAGPSKARKPEGSKVVDSLCENCVQRELRIEIYRQEMQKLECERECQTYILGKKTDEYSIARLLLKSLVSPELFRMLDEYIEGSTQVVQIHDLLSQFIQAQSLGSSSVPRQFLVELNDCVYGNSRNIVDSETSLLQSLSALGRRPNPVHHAPSDLLHAVQEMIRSAKSSLSERTQSTESRPNEFLTSDTSRSNVTNSGGNGINHYANGQKTEGSVTSAPVSPNRYGNTTNAGRTYPSVGAAGTGQPEHTPVTQAAAPPPAYMPYQPAVPPPPSRPYYRPSYGRGTINVNPIRLGLTPQTPVRPSTSSTAPPLRQSSQNYNPYVVGRYPPHYYPPFQ